MAIQKLILDLSGRGGLSDSFPGTLTSLSTTPDTANINLRYKAEEGQMVSGLFDPLSYDGYMSPAITGVVECTPQVSFTVPISSSEVDVINGNVYLFEAGTKLHIGTSFDDVTFADDRTISGATGTDLAIYQINGVRHLFYSYNHTTPEARIGIKNLDTNAFTDNWLGTGGTVTNTFSMSSSAALKMIPSGDGFMYILNKNKVHRVDGTTLGGSTGTIYRDLLTAPDSYFFTHGIDYRSNLYIVVQKNTYWASSPYGTNQVNGDCGVYIWNRQSTFFNTSDFIPLFGVKSVRSIFVSPGGKIRLFCVGTNNNTQIREYTGNSFALIKELPPKAAPLYQDSVSVVDGFTVWMGQDTRMYYYGNENPREKEFLFCPAQASTNASASGGAILFATAQAFSTAGRHGFYTSYYDGSSYLVRKIFPFATATVNSNNMAKNTVNTYSPVKFLPRMSNVKHLDIYLKQQNFTENLSTVEGSVTIYFNQSTTAWATKNITRGDINKGYISIEINKPYINAIQLGIANNNNVNKGIADVATSFAVVYYEPTTTIK